MEAAAILGIAKVHFLGFLDGQLASVPRELLLERAVGLIRRCAPRPCGVRPRRCLAPRGPQGHVRGGPVRLRPLRRSDVVPRRRRPLGALQALSIRDRAGGLRRLGRPPFRGAIGKAHLPHRHLGAGGDEDPRLPLPQDPGEGYPADPRAPRLPGVSRGWKRTSLPGRGFPGLPLPEDDLLAGIPDEH